MKTLLAGMAITLAASTAALAFDAETQAIIDKHKAGKLVVIADVAHLMLASAKWCYDDQDHSCAWTEVYLEVTDSAATFELGNSWDAETDYALTDEGAFNDNKICQTGMNWVPNLRGTRRSDGTSIGGRQLHALKQAVAESRPDLESYDDCFDYLYVSSDPAQQLVTLRQRQYVDGVHDPLNDVEVTVHFNAEDAAGLTLRL
ncbi:hypothetical protein [Devosia psychrophila]|uniref:Uncharacterized protein n=1 Tax=Devosia psychrophila TaxID=728005 RepID=A0A0F5PU01_9HYPH|nr:hypothetical protein [Devosia psychrophila]KKC31881.1 hypothetical protein WH91_17035 [Devosia psychrophila]SFB99852.1 hypothetical protein SAMN04488059_101313 [Devosia psychrophila]